MEIIMMKIENKLNIIPNGLLNFISGGANFDYKPNVNFSQSNPLQQSPQSTPSSLFAKNLGVTQPAYPSFSLNNGGNTPQSAYATANLNVPVNQKTAIQGSVSGHTKAGISEANLKATYEYD